MTAADLASLLNECADEVRAYHIQSTAAFQAGPSAFNAWKENDMDSVLGELVPHQTPMRFFAQWLETRHGSK